MISALCPERGFILAICFYAACFQSAVLGMWVKSRSYSFYSLREISHAPT
jgi:hypothetical protein